MDLHVYGLDPVTLNAGPMKPGRGFTPIAGVEKLGVGKKNTLLNLLVNGRLGGFGDVGGKVAGPLP